MLIGAAGLFVEGALIGDVFMMAQPEYGSSYASLREMLFSGPNQPDALEMFPDGKGELEDEVRRYQMLRFGSRIGFKPPVFKPPTKQSTASNLVAYVGHLGREGPICTAFPWRDLCETNSRRGRIESYFRRWPQHSRRKPRRDSKTGFRFSR